MMKRILYIVAIALFAVGCGGNKTKVNSYAIEGNIDGFVGTVEIKEMVSEETLFSASTTDGKFSFEIESPTQIMAALVLNGRPVMPLFLDAETISIKSVDGVVGAVGSRSNDAYRQLVRGLQTLANDLKHKGRVGLEELGAMQKRELDAIRKCYDNNSNNLLGLYLVMSKMSGFQVELEQILKDIESYPQEMKDMDEVKLLASTTEAKLRTSSGKQYVDIALPDEKGQMVSLSSVMKDKKVVLLYFWQAGGQNFKRGVSILTRAYGDYREKGLEVYGVNLDKDKETWIAGINGNGISWINVSDTKGWDAKAVKDYGIDAVPCCILIHAQTGEIIARDIRPELVPQTIADILK